MESGSFAHGGSGGGLRGDWNGGIRDTRLIKRAVQKKWNLPDVAFEAIPTAMARLAVGLPMSADKPALPTISNSIQAARVVAEMNRQNQALDPPVQEIDLTVTMTDEQRHQHIDAIVAERRRLAAIDGPGTLQPITPQPASSAIRPDDADAPAGGDT